MLYKLLKYDLLYSRSQFFGLGAALVIAAATLRFSLEFLEHLAILNIGIAMLATFISGAVGFMSIVLIYQNYSKNLFGNHGYLMFTLPLKPSIILISKAITSMLWFNFMMAVSVIGLLILVWNPGMTRFMDMEVFHIIWVTIIYFNAVAFLLMSIFFFVLTLNRAYFKGIKVHWMASGVIGTIYFIVWVQIIDWLFRDVGLGHFGIGIGAIQGWSYVGNGQWAEFTRHAIYLDFLFLGMAILFALIMLGGVVQLFKKLELR